jgi:hypothetical protein
VSIIVQRKERGATSASALIRTLTSEAHQVDQALVAFVGKRAKPRREEPRLSTGAEFLLQESAASSEASGDPAQDTLTIA